MAFAENRNAGRSIEARATIIFGAAAESGIPQSPRSAQCGGVSGGMTGKDAVIGSTTASCHRREIRADVVSREPRRRHVFGSDLHATAPKGLFNGLIWPEAGCASIAYDATAASNFLPLTAKAVIPRETRKPSLAVEPLRGAPSIASGQTIAIEAAMVRARERRNGDLKWRP
jgi:hypothetical protein